MRVLVVDPDDSFAGAVVEHLTQVGFEVAHAANPAQMEAHLRMRTYTAVLVDLSLRRMNGFDVARELRKQHPVSAVEIILVSPTHSEDSPEIQSLKQDTKCRCFLSKPVDYGALVAALKRPLASVQSPIDADRPEGERSKSVRLPKGKKFDEPAVRPVRTGKRFTIHWDNARVLAGLWLSRRTGEFTLEGKRSGTAGLVDGGIVDDAGRKLIRSALGGGQIRFKPTHVDGVGDWGRMGKLLFKAAHAAGDARALRKHLKATPTPLEVTAFARILPIGDDARKFLARVDGDLTVETILDREDIPAGEVAKDVMAVIRLGLLDLLQDGKKVEEITGGGRVASPHVASTVASDPDGSENDDALLQRLEREFATIETAPPPVVLGVPSDSRRAMVDRAAQRMRDRYEAIATQPDVSDEIKRVAAAISQRVITAHRTFNFDAQMATGGKKKASIVTDDEIEVLLAEGREHIAAKQWARADTVLARAHKKQIDHVPVLANLGWARLHNPDLDLGTRTEEGKDFLLLAEQFDPRDREGQYYLAQVLVASGMLEAAEERAERAVAQGDGDPLPLALLKKVRVMRAREADKTR